MQQPCVSSRASPLGLFPVPPHSGTKAALVRHQDPKANLLQGRPQRANGSTRVGSYISLSLSPPRGGERAFQPPPIQQPLSLVDWQCSERVPSPCFTCYTLYLYTSTSQTQDPGDGETDLGGGETNCHAHAHEYSRYT